WRRDVRMKQPKKSIVFVLRTAVIVSLILAIAGMQLAWKVDRIAVLYVVDRSDSMQEVEALTDWIVSADEHKRMEDVSGIVSFGPHAAIERMPTAERIEQIQLRSLLNTDFTNIETGLRAAYGLVPNQAAGRIVLLSDGLENSGSMLSQGKML